MPGIEIKYEPCSKCNGSPENGHCEYCGLFLDTAQENGQSDVFSDKIGSKLLQNSNIFYTVFSYKSFSTYRVEKLPDGKIYSICFYYRGNKFLIKGLSYDIFDKDIFGEIKIENLENSGLFPKVKNGYGKKIISIGGEYLSEQELKRAFLLNGLREFVIEFIKNQHFENINIKKLA